MEINGHRFTVGADPEIFVAKNGVVVNAHGLVTGDKLNPNPVNKGAVQVDGMALEFNIDPAENYEQFQEHLDVVQQQLKDLIGDYDFSDKASNVFDADYFHAQPFESLILGCTPDFNAWTNEENEPPDMELPMRTVGGHLHAGGFFTENEWMDEHFNKSARLARLIDEEVGVYSILWDKDDERRSMYGKAGSFRPKRYGMEYRTLSNAWLFNKGITKFVFDGVARALKTFVTDDWEPCDYISDIINSSNRNHKFFKNNVLADEVKELVKANA